MACIIRSDEVIGKASDQFVDDYETLKPIITADMELFKFKTCVDKLQRLEGLQFTLKSGSEEIELNPIGNMFGNSCRTLELSGAIDGIRVAESTSLGYITGIQYLKDGKMVTYGPIDSVYTEWLFTETDPIVGLFGTQ